MSKYQKYVYRDELRQKRKKRKVRTAFLAASSLTAVTVFIVYALFFSGWFLVKDIRVSGNNETSEGEIKKITGRFSNILFANPEKIKRALENEFPIIERVNVSKNFFRKSLTVEVGEREAIGIWCPSTSSGQACFYFDGDGVFFKAAPKFSGEVLINIEDGRIRNFNLTGSFDDKGLLEKLNSAKSILDDLKFIGYRNFFLPEGSFEFWIKTSEGWPVYLDKESDVATQLVALKKFLEEKISPDRRQSLQYVDLRVNNRIYYK